MNQRLTRALVNRLRLLGGEPAKDRGRPAVLRTARVRCSTRKKASRATGPLVCFQVEHPPRVGLLQAGRRVDRSLCVLGVLCGPTTLPRLRTPVAGVAVPTGGQAANGRAGSWLALAASESRSRRKP